MTVFHPKVIALAYQDGATEGFLDGMADDQVYFFRVVAWDEDRDRRLYLLGKVNRNVYEQLVEILSIANQMSAGLTWVPAWTFGDSALEAKANGLVEIGESSLETPAVLALGTDPAGTVEICSPNEKQLAMAIELGHAGSPGRLADWLDQRVRD